MEAMGCDDWPPLYSGVYVVLFMVSKAAYTSAIDWGGTTKVAIKVPGYPSLDVKITRFGIYHIVLLAESAKMTRCPYNMFLRAPSLLPYYPITTVGTAA
jgi:hypothetical protein